MLKLTASAGSGYTLTTYSAITYQGRAGANSSELKHIKSIVERFSITWVATSSGGGKTFTTANNPTWSSTDSTASNWTNSVYADNNGTHLEMSNLKTTKSSADTVATITMDVLVKKWGTADVTMDLTTAGFLACTT